MARRHLIAAGVALALLPAAAAAQSDSPRSATGFRVEGLLGYEAASFDSVRNGDGLLYGVGVGYDFGAGRMRFGLEAEASDSTANACEQFAGNDTCSEMGRDLYFGGRLGVLVSPNVLVYGKGGYTNMRARNRLTPIGGGAEIVTRPESDGFRLGAGAEIAIGARTYVRTEYRFSNYERSQSFDRHQGVIGFGFRF